MARRTEVGLVYATGLALVTFPAAINALLLIVAFQSILRAGGEAAGIVAFGLAGLACAAFFPLCISLSGQKFPQFGAAMPGELVAFYQAGYGVAAFGVGPLRDLTGSPLGTIYTAGSVVAAAMPAAALVAVTPGRRPAGKLTKFSKTPACAASSPIPGSETNRRGDSLCMSRRL